MSPDGNTIYMGDANAVGTSTGGARKYTKSGGAWTFQYALTNTISTNIGPFDMAVDYSGANPILYCTVNDGGANNVNNSIVKIIDTGSSAVGTTIATAGSFYSFHGIKFAPFGAPVVTVQPQATAVTEGNDAAFSITLASGTSTSGLTYVWKNGLGATLATHTPGILTDSYTFSNAQLGDNNTQIHCEVSNAQGSAASASATLTVNPAGQPPTVFFDVTPDHDPSFAGQTVSMSVTVTGTSPYTFSWAGPSGPISAGGRYAISTNPGGDTSTLTITGVVIGDTGNYYVGITNGFGGTSSAGSITVNTPAAPSITVINPSGTVTNNAGSTRSIAIGATDDSGVLTYQWKHGAANLSNGSHLNGATVAGATTSILTLAGVLGGDDGSYHCVVSNAGGSTDSGPTYQAVLFVYDPVVTIQPASHIVVAGTTLTVSVSAAGTGMTFAWSKNGNPLSDGGRISGSTTSTLSITSADASDAGEYSVALNSDFGSSPTIPATIAIAQTTPQAISATNLVVLQRGDGLEVGSANGNTLFLLQYTPSGSLVSCYQVPNSGVDSLIQAGNTPSEGWLTKAADGNSLVFAGYATALSGAPTLATSTGIAVNRGVGTLDKLGNYTLAARGTNHSGTNIRSAAGDGLGNFWTAGATAGIEAYLSGNPNGVQICPSIFNLRVVQPVNGDLMFSSSTVFGTAPNGSNGVYKLTGLPLTGTTVTTTGWYLPVGPTNQNDFGLYDFAVNPAGTVAYVSDDQGFSAPDIGGIQRYDKSGGVWSYSYRIGQASRGLTVDWNGANPVVYATTSIGGATNGDNFVHNANDIVKVVDTGANSSISTIATAVGGTFAGIRTAPGTSQTITFGAIADKFNCAGDFDPGATASSSLAVSYSIDSGNATIVGGLVHITGTGAVTVRASQAGNATYSAAASVTQTFNVTASSAVITVLGVDPTPVECHGTYTEAGATAVDSCGNSLSVSTSGSVNANAVGSYTLTYSATDTASATTSTATRVVNVADTTAPVITVLGSSPDSACLNGGVYADPGATANDACLGPITPTVSGIVDTTTAGSYTLTYSATDGANVSTAIRVVTVASCAPFVSVVVQPVNLVVTTKASATNSIVAGGTGPFGYQWYFIKTGTTTPKKMVKSATVPSVTNATLIINNVAGPANNGSYYCVVTNTTLHLGAQSANGTLTVYDAPTVVIAPPTKTLLAGFNYTIVAKVTKGAVGQTLSYQWKKDGNAILGATTSTYSLVNVQNPPDAAVYSCSVSNNSPTVGSASMTLSVTLDTEVPKVVLLLKPTDMAAKHALTTNDVPLDATGTNHAPDVDFIGKAVDKGLIVSAWVSNSVNQAVFPATFVKKITDLTGTNTSAGKPAFFLSHVSLVDGTNIFWGLATDSDGNTTNTAKGTKVFFIANPQALTLAKSGTGNITSVTDTTTKNWGNPTNTAVLAVGHNYTIKATPIGHLVTFQKWTVSDSTGPLADQLANPLTFTMTPGRTNTAVFSNHP